jgi:hypothetical protein
MMLSYYLKDFILWLKDYKNIRRLHLLISEVEKKTFRFKNENKHKRLDSNWNVSLLRFETELRK